MERCPLVVDYAGCAQGCALACARSARALLDVRSGRTRASHLAAVAEDAARQGFEDLVVAARDPRIVERLRRKKLARKLRIHHLAVGPFVLTQADLLRTLTREFSALLAKGFVYVSGHALPLAAVGPDLAPSRVRTPALLAHVFAPPAVSSPAAKSAAAPAAAAGTGTLLDLWTCFKQRARKDASTAVLLATQMSAPPAPTAANSDFVSAEGYVTVYEPATGLVLALLPFDRANPDPKVVDPAHICSVHPRVLSLSDKGAITTRFNPSPNLFVAGPKLAEGLAENPDCSDVLAFCSDSLAKSVQLNGVYLYTKATHLHINNLKDVWALIERDTQLASDVIEEEGNRSYWKALPNNVLAYETVAPGLEGAAIVDSLVTKGCKLEQAQLARCILDENAQVCQTDLQDCYVATGVKLSGLGRIEGPAILFDKDSADLFWVRSSHRTSWFEHTEQLADDVVKVVCTRRWAEENLPGAANAAPPYPSLDPDPERDVEAFLDALFDLAEAREEAAAAEPELQAADAKEVEAEAKDMILSTDAEHMSNLILELRSLRLSENVPEASMVAAITSAIMDVVLTPGANLRAIHDVAVERGLASLLEAFCRDDNPELVTAFYDGVVSHLETCTDDWKKEEVFVAACSAFDDVVANDEHLDEYVKRKKESVGFLASPLVGGYLEWLKASSGESSEE